VDHESHGRAVRLRWSDADRHGAVTALAAAGLVLAAALAVFGLPPVDLHMPIHRLGLMDPACGMTRGVRVTLRGDLSRAIDYNPAAPLVLLGGLLVLARWVVGRLTGRWLDASVRWTRPLVATTIVVVAALWIRQQANVALLTDH
jgi:uncharacterized protein DUF2752